MSKTEEELASSLLDGQQISNLLRSDGPIVSCVLLHAHKTEASSSSSSSVGITSTVASGIKGNDNDENVKISSTTTFSNSNSNNNDNENHNIETNDDKSSSTSSTTNTNNNKIILENQISQIMIDTTPKKSMVSKILGGPFTFLGQYEEEGIVLMVRKYDHNESNNDENLVVNPHQLQPPFDEATVYGDILIMRVAAVDEDEDGDDVTEVENENEHEHTKTEEEKVTVADNGNDSGKSQDGNHIVSDASAASAATAATAVGPKVVSNEEFFLNYTKEEYIKFASRTDIVAPPMEEEEELLSNGDGEEEEEGDEEEGGSDNDDDYDEDDDEDYFDDEDDEECQISMLNMILAQIIKRFREENGRGPDTEELLAMKSALAEKLGIEELIEDGSSAGPDSTTNTHDDGDDENEDERDNENEKDNDEQQTSSTTLDATDTGSTKRKSDDDNGERPKRVKFTNKDDVKFIPPNEASNENQNEIDIEDNNVYLDEEGVEGI